MSEEITKKNGHEVSIALIQKDIQYLRESMIKVETALTLLDKNFARKDELTQLEKIVGDMAKNWETKQIEKDKEWEKKIAAKVDVSDFEPIRTALTRINWMVISAVIIGLLGLVISSGQ